ncbi:MAG: hypothetical protein ABMA14_12660 [Hyphomonadaceae bacterium]
MALFAAPAFAQPVLDGKATVSADVGSFVQGYLDNRGGADAGKSAFRSIMGGMIAKGITAGDQDLLAELGSGRAVAVSAETKTIQVPALTGDVLAIAQMMGAVPNLNTLWRQPGEPTLQLIEISRWGKMAKDRITGFMANKLHASWISSTVNNAYSPFVGEFAGIKNALDGVTDAAVKREGKLLLKSAMEQVFVKCKEAGSPFPTAYLYNFAFSDVGDPALP